MKELSNFASGQAPINCAAWHPIQEELFVSGDHEGNLMFWLSSRQGPQVFHTADFQAFSEGLSCLGMASETSYNIVQIIMGLTSNLFSFPPQQALQFSVIQSSSGFQSQLGNSLEAAVKSEPPLPKATILTACT